MAVLLLVAVPAGAQVTVGTPTAASGNCFPFGCDTGPTRYQQVYTSSAFSSPYTIGGVTFFQTQYPAAGTSFRPGTYDVYLGVSNQGVNALSSDPSANYANEQFFGSFVLSGSAGAPSFTLTGSSPYTFDPAAGNLFLDVFVTPTGTNSSYYAYFDVDETGQTTSRAWGSSSYVNADSFGLVTRFEGAQASVTPEPSSMALLGTGLFGLVPLARRRKKR